MIDKQLENVPLSATNTELSYVQDFPIKYQMFMKEKI